MKLKNRKTGEIRKLCVDMERPDNGIRVYADDGIKYEMYNSLAELLEEWSDYEEPTTFWAIGWAGEPEEYDIENTPKELQEMAKQIGNYFSSMEEAEEAVRKLRSLKRLKNRGFRFDGYDVAHNSNGDLCGQIFYNAGDYCISDVEKYLDLIFGGKE